VLLGVGREVAKRPLCQRSPELGERFQQNGGETRGGIVQRHPPQPFAERLIRLRLCNTNTAPHGPPRGSDAAPHPASDDPVGATHARRVARTPARTIPRTVLACRTTLGKAAPMVERAPRPRPAG